MVAVSLLFWGAWGIFDKKALSHTTPFGQLAAVYSFSPLGVLILLAVLNTFVPGWQLSPQTLIYTAIGSAAYFIATGSYLVAMSKGEASLILGATASYPVVAQLLAFLMLNEALVPARVLGCCVVVAGIIAISSSGKKESAKAEISRTGSIRTRELALSRSGGSQESSYDFKSERDDLEFNQTQPEDRERDKRTFLPAGVLITVIGIALAVLGWAYRGILDKLACSAAQPLEVYLGKYIFDSLFGLAAVGYILVKRPQAGLFKKSLWPWASGSALCLAGGGAAYYIALSKASASYVIAITGCYPLIMYLLAVFILKEQFNKRRSAGILLITLGGIIMQSTQGA